MDTERAIHSITTCDECGIYPIVGKRYKSKTIFDYDCCELCFINHHSDDRNDFHAFQQVAPRSTTWLVAPRNRNSIYAGTASQAEAQLRMGRTAPYVTFAINRNSSRKDCHQITKFINRNHHLNLVRIVIVGHRDEDPVGSNGNASDSDEDSDERKPTAKEQSNIIANGLVGNTSIKVLQWGGPYLHPIANLISRNAMSSLKSLVLLSGDKDWALPATQASVFEALRKNKTLCTISLPQRNTKIDLVRNVVKTNPGLFNVRVNQKEMDRILDILTSINRYQWMSRWTNDDKVLATCSSKICILNEILSHFDGKKEETSTAMFLLFKSFPPTFENCRHE